MQGIRRVMSAIRRIQYNFALTKFEIAWLPRAHRLYCPTLAASLLGIYVCLILCLRQKLGGEIWFSCGDHLADESAAYCRIAALPKKGRCLYVHSNIFSQAVSAKMIAT